MTDEKHILEPSETTPAWLRAGLYPALWAWLLACLAYGFSNPESLSLVLAVKAGVMVGVLLLAEWRFPYQKRWGMTWRHFFHRDLFFIAVNGATFAAIQFALIWLAIDTARQSSGPLTGQSLWVQIPVALLAFEALQYTVHRLMHQSRGPVTNVLWRAHAIHHLPAQLYVVMHAVFHPLNAVIVRIVVQVLPVFLLGTDPMAIFVSSSVIALHGTVSHFNVDLRAGWANYLFVGPELHRYHHSASTHEAANYAATLSFFDVLGGTFLYRPGIPPAELGLRAEDGYPEQHAPWQSLVLPFSLRPVEPGDLSTPDRGIPRPQGS